MDFLQWTKLLTLVAALVSIPFALVGYRMRQNYQLERKLLFKIALAPQYVRSTEAAKVAHLRNCLGHLAGTWSRPLYPTAKQNMVTANLRSLGALYSTVVF
jgi:hypothetical protein